MDIDPIRDELLTVRELADRAGVEQETVRRWIYDGVLNNRSERVKLSSVKVGVRRRVSAAAYRAFVEQMSLEPEEDA